MNDKPTYQELENQIADLQKLDEEKYHSLFNNMVEGFARCQMLYENNQSIDFIYLEVNHAFEKLTGLKNVVGKRISEILVNP
jgi:PAS domain-containing protein